MNRRGQGISINVIVITAIALLVLVILSVLVIRNTSIFSGGVSACASQGQGECVAKGTWSTPSGCNEDSGFTNYPAECAKVAGESQICCRKSLV